MEKYIPEHVDPYRLADQGISLDQNKVKISDLARLKALALLNEDMLPLRELIEDEILLNLPIIPRHTPEECKVKLPYTDSSWEENKSETSPFHVLASLKGRKDKRQ